MESGGTSSKNTRPRIENGHVYPMEGPGLGAHFGVAVVVEGYEFLSEPTQPRSVERAAVAGVDESEHDGNYDRYPWRA